MANAEIITIGDELLSGETVDTSSNELDKKLEALGWSVVRHTTVRDVEEDIAEAFTAAAARSELVISSGGLGPTDDDVTLAALARALGTNLTLHAPTLDAIAQKFRSIGREMTPNNERQARVPELGEVIPNPVGTAPAFVAPLGRARIFLLPGVPREMRWLFDNAVAPVIRPSESESPGRSARPIHRRTLRVMGLGESRLEHEIRAVTGAHPSVRFGYRTLGAENHIKLAATGQGASEAIAQAEAAIRSILESRIFGVDDQELPVVVGELLEAAGHTVATAESCTGGLISTLLTDRSGSSKYVLGGFVTYANSAKQELVGVTAAELDTHGAVSAPVASQMAVGARARLGATWGLSATGIAGPTGGSPDKPVGTVFIAVAGPEDVAVRQIRLPGDRAQIRRGTALSVLDLLRLRLLG
ncbi:MAG: competence/damage-inducible protein A [Deltaproteobacteria bacterium]|nr:competence/damage-inducible protein A [Deltaproteobacteria bacterium]